jgi:uncharacterized protein DUF6152
VRLHILGFGAIALLIAGSSISAHHSWPVSYSKQVTVNGAVTSYEWGNPHVMFGLDVRTNGGVEKWNVGGPSTQRMANNGWDRNTLKPGDAITAVGYQFADGQKILRLEKIVMANGKEMFLYGGGSR